MRLLLVMIWSTAVALTRRGVTTLLICRRSGYSRFCSRYNDHIERLVANIFDLPHKRLTPFCLSRFEVESSCLPSGYVNLTCWSVRKIATPPVVSCMGDLSCRSKWNRCTCTSSFLKSTECFCGNIGDASANRKTRHSNVPSTARRARLRAGGYGCGTLTVTVTRGVLDGTSSRNGEPQIGVRLPVLASTANTATRGSLLYGEADTG